MMPDRIVAHAARFCAIVTVAIVHGRHVVVDVVQDFLDHESINAGECRQPPRNNFPSGLSARIEAITVSARAVSPHCDSLHRLICSMAACDQSTTVMGV